jgi:hypothetical protein
MGVRYGNGKTEEDKDFKYTEEFMQAKLSNFFAYNTVKYDIDGLYIFDWESDKLIETRSGLIYEFEIKVSKADFKNDFKHKKDKHIILEGEERYGDKYLPKYYEYLEANRKSGHWAERNFRKYADNSPRYLVGGHKRPNYFYYCTPPGLVNVEEVPDYAGLVYIDKAGMITIKKKAPKLHGEKIKDEDLGLGEKFYFNMDAWRTKCKDAWKSRDLWREKLDAELEEHGQGRAYKDLENELEGYRKEYHRLSEQFEATKSRLYRDLNDNNRMIRRLVREIQKHDAEFDYGKFEDEIFGTVEKKDGEE